MAEKRIGSPPEGDEAYGPNSKRVKESIEKAGGDRSLDKRPSLPAGGAPAEGGAAEEPPTETSADSGSPVSADAVIAHFASVESDVEVMRAHSNAHTHNKQVQAYGKLAGRGWTFYVQKLEIVIGRSAAEVPGTVDIDLSPSKVVSRRHATIKYNMTSRQWEILTHGRNGLRVDGFFLRAGFTTALRSGNIVDVGNVQMMFVLPDADPVIAPEYVAKTREAIDRQRAPPAERKVSQVDQSLPDINLTVAEDMKRMYTRSTHTLVEAAYEEDLSSEKCKNIKPPFSYATMISQAILSSPEQMMTLADIYAWISNTYAFYRHQRPGWQNSIRHNLSLNKAFEKVARKEHEPGKGSKWHIVDKYRDEVIKKAMLSCDQYRNHRRLPFLKEESSAPMKLVSETLPRASISPSRLNTGESQSPAQAQPGLAAQPQARSRTPRSLQQPPPVSTAPPAAQTPVHATYDPKMVLPGQAGFGMPLPYQNMQPSYAMQPYQYLQPYGMGMPYYQGQPGQSLVGMMPISPQNPYAVQVPGVHMQQKPEDYSLSGLSPTPRSAHASPERGPEPSLLSIEQKPESPSPSGRIQTAQTPEDAKPASAKKAHADETQTPARAPPTANTETPLLGSAIKLPAPGSAGLESSPVLWKYMNLESTPVSELRAEGANKTERGPSSSPPASLPRVAGAIPVLKNWEDSKA